jgi:hypothetical protein
MEDPRNRVAQGLGYKDIARLSWEGVSRFHPTPAVSRAVNEPMFNAIHGATQIKLVLSTPKSLAIQAKIAITERNT